jgi:hypothetical protein
VFLSQEATMNGSVGLVWLNIAAGAARKVCSNRRVVLVDFSWTRDKDPRLSLGHASLLAALRVVDGLDVRSVVMPINAAGTDVGAAANAILAHTEGLAVENVDVAIGAYVWGEDLLNATLTALRRRGFRGRIILGGPQISYAGAGLESLYPEADVFVRGYGETALSQLACGIARRSITGVHYAGDEDRREQSNVDLDSLPSPWLAEGIALPEFVRWETQRGCPFRCSFCQHREAGARLRHRCLGAKRIEREIDLFAVAGVNDIAVLDPVFNLGPSATAVLRRFSARGFTGRLSLQCRPECIDAPFLDAATPLDVCLEFGLQTIYSDEAAAVRRGNNIRKVDAALADVRRRGIDHEVSLIFGLPLQTRASFEASVRWCLERRVPVIKAFPLMLLRGTELESERSRWGFIDSGGSMPMVVESHSFGREDWLAMALLSDALKLTEGRHPSSIEELRRVGDGLRPELSRWMPRSLAVGA